MKYPNVHLLFYLNSLPVNARIRRQQQSRMLYCHENCTFALKVEAYVNDRNSKQNTWVSSDCYCRECMVMFYLDIMG